MVIVFRSDATEADVKTVIERVTEMGLKPHVSKGETRTIVGCVGDEDRLRDLALVTMDVHLSSYESSGQRGAGPVGVR